MILTEEEAKKKWCPMSHVSAFPHKTGDKVSLFSNRDISLLVPGNSFDPATDITKCIASACMAWRREKDTYGDDYGKDIPADRGFCGIGGKP